MAEIPKLNELKGTDKVLTSIGNKLDGIAASTGKWAKGLIEAGDNAQDLANKLDRQLKVDVDSKEAKAKIEDMVNQLDALAKKSKTVAQIFKDKLGEGIDYAAKKLAKLQVSIAGLAIDGLISGIQRVYDLQERWAEVTGKLNMQMGKLSPSMSKFTKDASSADVAVRALGGSMGEGSRMFGEFATAYGKMETGKGTKFVLGLARGFDLGGEAAGKLSRILDNVSTSVGDKAQHEQAEYFKTITLQADKAGIPLNAFAKDIAENSKLMSQFGKIGAKTFVQSAAYLKKFNIGLKEMDQFMSKFDTFDDAASSIAKLNTAFGTSINSLNMMLEQNPAKRFETIRSALLSQGKTFNTLSRNEIQLLKQQTGLDEEALSAMLDKKNAGVSYEKFLAEKDKKEKARLSAEKLMHKQLQATATTLFNFGLAADKITTAIANAIKPFLKLLGLAGQGDKDFKSFGQVMQGITDKVADFFNKLAKNKDWIAFMEKAAALVKKVASGIGDFFGKDLDKNIETIIKWFKRFEYASAALLALWGGAKILKTIGMVKDLFGAFGKLKSIPGLIGKAQSFLNGSGGTAMPGPGGIDVPGPNSAFAGEGAKGAGMGSKALGMAGKAVVGAGIGYGTGKLTSMGVEAMGGAKESTAGNIGAAALGGIGMLIAGPLGAALGGVIGQTFGDLGSFLYDEFKTTTKSERELNSATNALKEAQEKTAKLTQRTADTDEMIRLDREVAAAKEKKDNRTLFDLSEKANKLDKKKYKTGLDLNGLSQDERDSLAARLKDLQSYGIETNKTTDIISSMAKSGNITASQLDVIGDASHELQKVMKKLAEETENEVKQLQAKEAANNQFEKLRQDRLLAADDQEIARKKEALDRAQKTSILVDESDVAKAGQEREEYEAFKQAFGKKAALEQLGEKRTKEYQAKAKADYETAQVKKLNDQKKSEELEQTHQENLYKIALQNQIMQGDEYKKFRAGAGAKLDAADAFGGFLKSKGAEGKVSSGQLEQFLPHAAEGGVFKKKQTIVVAEQGPEAVIPLKAFSGGMDLGGGASGGPVNYAGGRGKGGTGGGDVKVVAGDVYLDSKLVGRHLVRSILNDARG